MAAVVSLIIQNLDVEIRHQLSGCSSLGRSGSAVRILCVFPALYRSTHIEKTKNASTNRKELLDPLEIQAPVPRLHRAWDSYPRAFALRRHMSFGLFVVYAFPSLLDSHWRQTHCFGTIYIHIDVTRNTIRAELCNSGVSVSLPVSLYIDICVCIYPVLHARR